MTCRWGLIRFTSNTYSKVSTGAPDSSMFPRDLGLFLVLFHKLQLVCSCQHPQTFFSYHPFKVCTCQSQSVGKASFFSSSMHHQGKRLCLSCPGFLITLAFVLRRDSSWFQNGCHCSSYHLLTLQYPKFGSRVRGTVPSSSPFLMSLFKSKNVPFSFLPPQQP